MDGFFSDWDAFEPVFVDPEGDAGPSGVDFTTLFARQAEVFAAYVDMADHETGRVIQAIEDLGEIDNTLIFYVAGDNGTRFFTLAPTS